MRVSYTADGWEWFEPLPRNVTLGENVHLYSSFAFRHFRSKRPDAVRVGAYSSIYSDTCFDLGPDAEVTIGNYSTLADPVISTNGRVAIGSHCMIGWDTVMADVAYAVPPDRRDRVAVPRPDPRATEIVLADNVWIGARAVLLGGARIGEGSVVGAAAVVDFEVPPYSLAAGNPARVIGPLSTGSR